MKDPPSSPLRRATNYQPTKWDGSQIHLLTTTSFTEELRHTQRRERLKEDVRTLFINKEKSPSDQLKLIDSLQQLGVAYHFKEEIKHVLSNLMEMELVTDDVYVISLFFRLSREHGVEISQDLLVKSCKDDEGCFKLSLSHDIRGMISVYEASFFAMEGEDEVDEAKEFAIKHLSELRRCSSTEQTVVKRIARALELPLHLMTPRLRAWLFMEDKDNEEEIMDPKLFELGKLDFNMTQSIYKRELKELMSWWTDLSIAGGELKFARDWLVESYFSTTGLAFEPRFQRYRIEFTKAISIINVIDDIYDIYGSLEELQLFTHAVERWEESAIQSLPEYMKICIRALLRTVNGIAQTIMEEKGLDVCLHLKRGGELRRGDVTKSIQCFMNETNSSEMFACEHIKNVTNKCWKKLNREWMMSSQYEEMFKKVAMNLPRVAHLMYLQANDGNDELSLKMVNERVISLLLQPIELKESYA